MQVVVLVGLVAAAAVCVAFGLQSTDRFVETIWGQLLWVVIGVLATTFLVERLLRRAEEDVRRRQVHLGLRIRVASALDYLSSMVGNGLPVDTVKASAAIMSGGKAFLELVQRSLDEVSSPSASVSLKEYERVQLEVASLLRDIAWGFVRAFSPANDLVTQSRRLTDLALEFRWRPDATGEAEHRLDSMAPSDADRTDFEARVDAERLAVRELCHRSARELQIVAEKASLNQDFKLAI